MSLISGGTLNRVCLRARHNVTSIEKIGLDLTMPIVSMMVGS